MDAAGPGKAETIGAKLLHESEYLSAICAPQRLRSEGGLGLGLWA
jgi:hypothetical protein